MAKDVFNRERATLGGVITADGVKLVFAGGLSSLAQQLQFNYAQNITRIFELTSNAIYYVAGRSQGQANINRVVGPTVTVDTFFNRFGDVCNAARNTMSVSLNNAFCGGADGRGVSGATETIYNLSFCVIRQASMSIESQNMIMNESTSLEYGSLSLGREKGFEGGDIAAAINTTFPVNA